MRPGSKDLKGFPEPASDDVELKSLVSVLCLSLYCSLRHTPQTCWVAHQGNASLTLYPQAREVRCAAFATTAALVVATQGADKLQFYKKPFELAGGLCKGAAMPAP